MDNESFRFLCAVKSGIPFIAADHNNFAESWLRSQTVSNRLLAYMNGLEPHDTRETITLNEARLIITSLTKPLADIARIIEVIFCVLMLKFL